MKSLRCLSQMLLVAILFCSSLQLRADKPPTSPPRGNAYGYYLKDGTFVLFVYEADGTRSFTLSNAKPKLEYRLDCTDDLSRWQTLGTMVVQGDGTAHYVDPAPSIPHRYYQVTLVK